MIYIECEAIEVHSGKTVSVGNTVYVPSLLKGSLHRFMCRINVRQPIYETTVDYSVLFKIVWLSFNAPCSCHPIHSGLPLTFSKTVPKDFDVQSTVSCSLLFNFPFFILNLSFFSYQFFILKKNM